MNKFIIIIQVLTLFLGMFMYLSLDNEIKKHSIHPIHGNYEPKIDPYGMQCEPWNSCR